MAYTTHNHFVKPVRFIARMSLAVDLRYPETHWAAMDAGGQQRCVKETDISAATAVQIDTVYEASDRDLIGI
jgi:hypothetical protein